MPTMEAAAIATEAREDAVSTSRSTNIGRCVVPDLAVKIASLRHSSYLALWRLSHVGPRPPRRGAVDSQRDTGFRSDRSGRLGWRQAQLVSIARAASGRAGLRAATLRR